MIIPHDIVGKGDDTLINKEQPCLADKEAAWEIIRQKKKSQNRENPVS